MPSATVIFGDVLRSRRDPSGSAAWLRDLVADLDSLYGAERLAPFGFTQGDELQGLLRVDADPFRGILSATLDPAARAMRWVVVRGVVDEGQGPATERTGDAFLRARAAIEAARAEHDRLVVLTGAPTTDELINDLTPAFADLLDGLTKRQRVVARLALLDGLRQADVADRLGIRRATVSISFTRARIRTVQRLLDAIRRVYRGVAS